jgi:hypothetical protein
MIFSPIDVKLRDHERIFESCEDLDGEAAMMMRAAVLGAFTWCLLWCAEQLSDGEIPRALLHAHHAKEVVSRLLRVELLEDAGRVYRVRNYAKKNRTRESIEASIEAERQRKADYEARRCRHCRLQPSEHDGENPRSRSVGCPGYEPRKSRARKPRPEQVPLPLFSTSSSEGESDCRRIADAEPRVGAGSGSLSGSGSETEVLEQGDRTPRASAARPQAREPDPPMEAPARPQDAPAPPTPQPESVTRLQATPRPRDGPKPDEAPMRFALEDPIPEPWREHAKMLGLEHIDLVWQKFTGHYVAHPREPPERWRGRWYKFAADEIPRQRAARDRERARSGLRLVQQRPEGAERAWKIGGWESTPEATPSSGGKKQASS